MKETIWNGFKRIDFEFEGREAILVFPDKANEDKNWLLKTEYFDAFPDYEIEMVKRGWHLAYIKNITRWCLDEDLDLKKRFADYLTTEFGLHKKCVPIGMSCGGLIGSKFAARYPDYVSALYLDAPVLDIRSWPGGLGTGIGTPHCWEECKKIYGLTDFNAFRFSDNPLDHVKEIADTHIPIFMVCGDSDTVVPYQENGEPFYKEMISYNAVIEQIVKPDCDHHPHSLEDPTPIVSFIEKIILG